MRLLKEIPDKPILYKFQSKTVCKMSESQKAVQKLFGTHSFYTQFNIQLLVEVLGDGAGAVVEGGDDDVYAFLGPLADGTGGIDVLHVNDLLVDGYFLDIAH